MCADGAGPLKCRTKSEKVADAPARKKPPSIPLQTLGRQPAVAAPGPRVPAAAVAELPMIYVEAVASSGVADAHVVAQAKQ